RIVRQHITKMHGTTVPSMNVFKRPSADTDVHHTRVDRLRPCTAPAIRPRLAEKGAIQCHFSAFPIGLRAGMIRPTIGKQLLHATSGWSGTRAAASRISIPVRTEIPPQ